MRMVGQCGMAASMARWLLHAGIASYCSRPSSSLLCRAPWEGEMGKTSVHEKKSYVPFWDSVYGWFSMYKLASIYLFIYLLLFFLPSSYFFLNPQRLGIIQPHSQSFLDQPETRTALHQHHGDRSSIHLTPKYLLLVQVLGWCTSVTALDGSRNFAFSGISCSEIRGNQFLSFTVYSKSPSGRLQSILEYLKCIACWNEQDCNNLHTWQVSV